MYLKTTLTRHRLSFLLSWSWAVLGILLFAAVVKFLFVAKLVRSFGGDMNAAKPMLWGSCIAYLVVAWFLMSARRLPYSNTFETLLSTTFVATSLLFIFLAATREFYSGTYLAAFLLFQIFWFGLEVYFRNRFVTYNFVLFPASVRLAAEDFPGYRIMFFSSPADLNKRNLDAVIVDFNMDLSADWLAALAQCQNNDIPILPLRLFLENTWGRVPVELLKTAELPEASSFRPYLLLKPVLEWLLAAAGLLIASPVMLFTAALVKFTSPGPILFRQERVGFKGKPFSIYKFRTMLDGMERLGVYPTAENDERLTSVGAFLRKYHLDELPQLLNVLKGEMAIVGPRPEALQLYEAYNRKVAYSLRTMVRQGVTSWALIHQGNVAGVEASKVKLSYDLYYIKHVSPFLDFYIILKTILVIAVGMETLGKPGDLKLFPGKRK